MTEGVSSALSNAAAAALLDVHVWRGDSEGGAYERFAVEAQPQQTVLDLVTWIQRRLAPGLSYRFACRVGMCGSCAMTVNGRPRWACRTLVRDVLQGREVRIGPLANLPVVKDLACDMTVFFEKWQRAGGRFVPGEGPRDRFAPIRTESKARRAVDAAIECINCGICYAACDVVADDPDYLGPAALNRAWSLINDEKDGARGPRLAAVAAAGGCASCHSNQQCSAHCPKGLNPTAAIAGLKRTLLGALLRGEV